MKEMYWGLRLMPGTSKKWKVCPIGASAGNAQNTALDMAGTAGSFGVLLYLIQAKTKDKKF